MPDSSPESELATEAEGVTPEAQVDGKEVSAESSPAEDGQQKGDMLSAVSEALEPKEASPDSANQGSEKDPAEAAEKEGGEEGEDSEDFSEEEKARLSQKARRRFHKLSGEVSSLTEKIGEIEPQAQQFRQIMDYVTNAGLSVDEMNQTFDVARNIKQNPLRAYEQLRPVMDQLERMVGVQLPAELQQAVNLGQITEDHARQLARSSAAAALHEQRAQRVEHQSLQERQRNDLATRWNDAANVTTEWEASKAKSDPDWKLKQPRVIELLELNLLKKQRQDPNYVPSKDDAVEMANTALKTVNEELKRFRPKPKQIDTVTDGGTSPRSAPKPKTMLEAIDQALAG